MVPFYFFSPLYVIMGTPSLSVNFIARCNVTFMDQNTHKFVASFANTSIIHPIRITINSVDPTYGCGSQAYRNYR